MGSRIFRGILIAFLFLTVSNVWGLPTQFDNRLLEFREWNDSLVKCLIQAEEVGRYDNARFQTALADWNASKKEAARIKEEIISEIKVNPAMTMEAMEKFLRSRVGRRSRNLFSDLIDLNKGYLGKAVEKAPNADKTVTLSGSAKPVSNVSALSRPAHATMQRSSSAYMTPQQQFETFLKLMKELGVEEKRARTEVKTCKSQDDVLKFLERAAQNQESLVRKIRAIPVTVTKLKPIVGEITQAIEAQISTIRQRGAAMRNKDKKFASSINQDVLDNNKKGFNLGGELAKVAAEELGPDKARELFRR